MTTISDVMIEYIRDFMSEKFYMEGEDKDYYFGKSELNDELTLFYNDIGKATEFLSVSVEEAIKHGILRIEKEYSLNVGKLPQHIDYSTSAFAIPVYSKIIRWKPMDESEYNYWQINYMQSGVLEKAIKDNPERWEFYKKRTNKK